jgi:hypothetical protein
MSSTRLWTKYVFFSIIQSYLPAPRLPKIIGRAEVQEGYDGTSMGNLPQGISVAM